MLELEKSVINEVYRQAEGQESYGINACQKLGQERPYLWSSIQEKAEFADVHLQYFAEEQSPFFSIQGLSAGYLAFEGIFNATGFLYKMIKEQVNSNNLSIPGFSSYMEEGIASILEMELDDENSLLQLENLTEHRFLNSEDYMNNLIKTNPNTYHIIQDLNEEGVNSFRKGIKKIPYISSLEDLLSEKMEKHLFSTLVEFYDVISAQFHQGPAND